MTAILTLKARVLPSIPGPVGAQGIQGIQGIQGAAGSPAGASLTVQYNNASAFGGMSGTSWDDTNRSLTITGATVTTSKPIFDLSQTWNNGAVSFTGLKFNVTNTASGGASKLLDLQLGGTSQFNVDINGFAVALNRHIAPFLHTTDDTIALKDGVGVVVGSGRTYAFSSDGTWFGTPDVSLFRNAAGIVEINNGTPGTFRDLKARKLLTPVTSTLTIATGAVTATGGYHLIDTEAAAATDDLDTISGGADGQILIIRPADSARTVVAKDGTGNLQLAGDHTMDNAQDTLTLFFVGALSAWLEIARSNNGA